MAKGPKPRPVTDRFWAMVQIGEPDECWHWQGHVLPNGYGMITTKGDGWDGYRTWLVHRLAYYLTHGNLPVGLDIDHACHDPSCETVWDCPHRRCCNPAHLRPLTRRANMMRGNSFMADRARQTHCVHGHEFTPATTRIKSNGTRSCKVCDAEQQRARYRKRASSS